MSTRRPASPRPERAGGRANPTHDGVDDGMRLRFRLSPHDTALLRALTSDDEQPTETIRRLIRTAALTAPILTALEELRHMPAGVALVAQPASSEVGQDDAVRRQADALTGWLSDDD